MLELNYLDAVHDASKLDWEKLVEAHHLMRQGYVAESMKHYRELLDENTRDLKARFETSTWVQVYGSEQPSLIWALILLSEYYIETNLWDEWLILYSRCFEWYTKKNAQFSPGVAETVIILVEQVSQLTREELLSKQQTSWMEIISKLVSISGWATISTRYYSLKSVTNSQLKMLEYQHISNLERGLHYVLLTYTFMKQREKSLALYYGEEATKILTLENEPYYAVRARIMLASVYDYFKDYSSQYAGIALVKYHEIEQVILSSYPQLEPKIPYYSEGWTLIEIENFRDAVHRFKLGIQIARQSNLDFSCASNQYGLASALMQIGRRENDGSTYFREALDYLEMARRVFGIKVRTRDVSPLMMVVCLHTEAIIYEHFSIYEGNLAKALSKAQKGFEWLKLYVDDPVQKHNIIRRLAKINFKKKKWFQAGFYYLWDIKLRLIIRKFR